MVRTADRTIGLTAPSPFSSAPSDVIQMYKHMLLARALSERMWLLNRTGKAHLVVTCEGHEGAQVGSACAIRPGHDFVLPYYRDLGVVLTLGMTARDVMLGTLHRAADPNSGGKQMPSHWSYPSLRIVSQSSVVATQLLHAVGIAHAARIKGEDTVAVVYFGEGATSKGDFHEALNWAGLFNLSVVFICENNGYAISVPARKQLAIPQVADRAQGYGFPGVTVDGSDAIAVYEVAKEAIERARRGGGPTLIEAITYRYSPHTNNDNDSYYRSKE
jgi:2-oxoisovalerate dehydrogenase E1 component alpha subunit